jgi:hypothetical protein
MARRLTQPARAAYRLPCLVSLALCAVTVVDGQQRSTGDRAQPTIAEILVRAGDFVRDAATQLRDVVADETYAQELFPPGFPGSGLTSRAAQRRMQSEALFLWLLAASNWMFVRNVVTVDGRAVPDSGDRLNQLFKTPSRDAIAYIRELQEENARFDIGPVIRTVGDPTFTLRFLAPESQRRFAFNRVGTERIGTARATVIAYKERERPSLVKVDGQDALSSGTIWVNAADGTVLRTQLRLRRPNENAIAVSVSVDFQQDTHLHVWVPRRMAEEYRSRSGETLVGSATYTNFRRFDTSVRVLAP